tara:strand:+ start:259 stop:537 length:279 start_codon:yes stop_codon:yes gene_type:complete
MGIKDHKLPSGLTIEEAFTGRQDDKMDYAYVLAKRNNTDFETELKKLRGWSVRKAFDPVQQDNAFYVTRLGEELKEGNVLYVTTPPPLSGTD